MAGTPERLPRGRHFALTWGIPEHYGGMTSALLRRSRAFVSLGGASVDVLTLDDRPDVPELQERMLRSGELVAGMRLRNLWEELRERAPDAAQRPPAAVEPLSPRPDDEVVEHAGVVLLRRRAAGDGAVEADRFRRDGSLLATDRTVLGRRAIVAHAQGGEPLREWRGAWALYRWWLDRLTAGETSWLLADSKTAARFVAGYRRDHVVTVHVVHGAHRIGDEPGTLRASREQTLRHAADYDGVVVLTRRQRDELEADGLTPERPAIVIPNAVELPPPAADADRDPARGVVLASLVARKRLTHVIAAIAAVRGGDPGIVLDVYGEGDEEEALRGRIRDEGLGDAVRLRGFRPDARAEFGRAGFSLLTSTSEGLPLVLAESMAAGCIPIAYDIRYGPADIIRDGVDGFLVAEGDVEGMARRILELRRMPPGELEAMRRRAVERAQEFSDAAITARWARELAGMHERKRPEAPRADGILTRACRRIRRALGR